MKIMDHVDLYYPDANRKAMGAERRKAISDSKSKFAADLKIEEVARIFNPYNPDKFMTFANELSNDEEVLNYRLDCLEDFIANPDFFRSLKELFMHMPSANAIDDKEESINSFYKIKEQTADLDSFLDSIIAIGDLFKKFKDRLKSKAMNRLYDFFMTLPESEEYKKVRRDHDELNETFSKTIRSVKIGVNFDSSMTPDSAGIIEISYDKIYPKGNVLERLIFNKSFNKENFLGEEHLNSVTRNTPVDIDTALFRELTKYTKEYALRVANALKSYKASFITDISELISQFDFYERAANVVTAAQARGMTMCRPKFLPADKRVTNFENFYDLILYSSYVSKDASEKLDDIIIKNSCCMDDSERLFMVTGVNNGGKTTFARGVGVCQVMAQMGLYVPAEKAEISLCDNIFTHFPSLEQTGIDTSRFTVEIKDLKEIIVRISGNSMVILNESLQSTTPEECLKIAGIHTELLARAGVRGIYVTHLTGLYNFIDKINKEDHPSKMSSLVAEADEKDNRRLYKITKRAPLKESQAMTIYKQFGATAEDLKL